MAGFYMRDGKAITPSRGGRSIVVATVLAGMAATSTAGFRDADDQAWGQLDLTHQVVKTSAPCYANSSGEVREFLLHTPCEGLDRSLLTLSDGHGNEFAVSVAWVRMASTDNAHELETRADKGAVLPLDGMNSTGGPKTSRQQGDVVVIAEAATITGRPDAQTLRNAVVTATELPPP